MLLVCIDGPIVAMIDDRANPRGKSVNEGALISFASV